MLRERKKQKFSRIQMCIRLNRLNENMWNRTISETYKTSISKAYINQEMREAKKFIPLWSTFQNTHDQKWALDHRFHPMCNLAFTCLCSSWLYLNISYQDKFWPKDVCIALLIFSFNQKLIHLMHLHIPCCVGLTAIKLIFLNAVRIFPFSSGLLFRFTTRIMR